MVRSMALAALLSLSLASSTASARIAMDPIRAVVRAARPDLGRCMRACSSCTGDEYRLTATFTIEMDGTVSAVDAATELPDANVVQCIVGVIAQLRFPSRSGGGSAGLGPVRIHYPFLLRRPDPGTSRR